MSPIVIIYAALVNICVLGDKPQVHWGRNRFTEPGNTRSILIEVWL